WLVLRFCLDAALDRSNGPVPARLTLHRVEACRSTGRVNHHFHYTMIARESDHLGSLIRKNITHRRRDRAGRAKKELRQGEKSLRKPWRRRILRPSAGATAPRMVSMPIRWRNRALMRPSDPTTSVAGIGNS